MTTHSSMNPTQFAEQIEVLRHLIEEQSKRPGCQFLINRSNRTDRQATKKFHAYMSQVFNHRERDRRIHVLSIMLGRTLKTTNALTLGEVFGFLSWLEYNGIALDTLTWAKENTKNARNAVIHLDGSQPEEAPPYVEDTAEAYSPLF